MESATTNLSEVNADFLRVFNPATRVHEDVRDIFVPKASLTEPAVVETQVGDEIDLSLAYENPTNEQVPALQGLLEYLDDRFQGSGTINKYYTINKRYNHTREGDTHVTQLKRQINTRNLRFHIETYAPVFYQKKISTTKVVRPIYIFAN